MYKLDKHNLVIVHKVTLVTQTGIKNQQLFLFSACLNIFVLKS